MKKYNGIISLIILILTFIWSCEKTTKNNKTTLEKKQTEKELKKEPKQQKIIETDWDFLKSKNKKTVSDSIIEFGLRINDVNLNYYKTSFKKDTLELINEVYETIKGTKIELTNEKIENPKAKIKIGFGFVQYLTDEKPARPLNYMKFTKWIDLVVNNNIIEIPEFANNSDAIDIYKLLDYKDNSDIKKWIQKKDFDKIKNESINEQKEFYTNLLENKDKFDCCPEYIKQANDFLNTESESIKFFDNLYIELFIKKIIIEINGVVNGKKYRRVIIEM